MEFKKIGNWPLSNNFQNNLLKLFHFFHYCSADANLYIGFQTQADGTAAK